MDNIYNFFLAITARYKNLKKYYKDFHEHNLYLEYLKPIIFIYLKPLVPLIITVLGNTAVIWFGYISYRLILSALEPPMQFPAIVTFVKDGVFLIISFSFFSNVYYETSKLPHPFKKFGFFELIAVLLIAITAFVYVRVIVQLGLIEENSNVLCEDWYCLDNTTFVVSMMAFFGSILLLYISMVRGNYIEYKSGSLADNREDGLEDLTRRYNAG